MPRITEFPNRREDCNIGDGRIPLSVNWRRSRTYACGVVTIVLIACGWPAHGQNSSQHAKPVQSGSALAIEASKTFAATCAGCHGLDGRGGERGPNIATRPEVLRRSDAELLQILRNGIPASGMPSFAALGDSKLGAMVSYLRTLQRKNDAAPISGDVKRGESLFFGKARCSDCHSVNGKGGFIGSDLSDYAAGSSVAEIKNAIANPDIDAKQNRSKTMLSLRDGTSLEGVIRNEDNFSLQLQSTDGVFHFIQKSEIAEMKPAAQPLMPDDYGKVLSAAELDDIVGYLMSVARGHAGSPRPNRRRRRD
jgi:cytochrome c oxidase cbb3-type subunit III